MSVVNKIIIAIDGFAGCGKSTTAKLVAQQLNYMYIDTGAMYRAVALYFLRNQIDFSAESPEMKDALDNIYIDLVRQDNNHFPITYLNGKHVEEDIRSPEISAIVSPVSVHRMVRKEMVAQQQRMGQDKSIVMDGRDIGTVVFPRAELKVFMKADVEVRAARRLQELQARGIEINHKEIRHNLEERDHIDSTRKVGPLKQAGDAIVIDTTTMSVEEQVEKVCSLAKALIYGKKLKS